MEVKFGGFRFVDTQQPFSRQPFSGAHESRERYALSGRQPIFLHPFHGATEPAKQYAVAGRQPFPRQPFRGATELRSNTPFPGGGFRRLRTAGTISKRIDTPYGGLPVGC